MSEAALRAVGVTRPTARHRGRVSRQPVARRRALGRVLEEVVALAGPGLRAVSPWCEVMAKALGRHRGRAHALGELGHCASSRTSTAWSGIARMPGSAPRRPGRRSTLIARPDRRGRPRYSSTAARVGSSPCCGERSYALPAGVLKAGDNLIAVNVLDTYVAAACTVRRTSASCSSPTAAKVPLGGWQYQVAPAELRRRARPGSRPRAPATLYNAMIAPLGQYGLARRRLVPG